MDKLTHLVGRLLLAQLFLLAGVQKIPGYAGTQGYMEAMGVPGALLPLVIALEIGGGLALMAGFFTRLVAWALALFCIASALLFHADFSDQMQVILFMKNWAIAGGLLVVAAQEAPGWTWDQRRARTMA
jgi:putative oxidoreductase